MSRVIANMSMSLDGFIEDRGGGVGDLFAWLESGSELDAIMVDVVPLLLGAGKPFCAGVGSHVHLEDPVITAGTGVTHMLYRVGRSKG